MAQFYQAALPQEICELCIDALADTAKDDKPSRMALAQCLHASRVFWIRVRRHIFSDVQVQCSSEQSGQSIEEQLVALLAMMASNGTALPFSIARLIKSFTLNTHIGLIIHEFSDIERPFASVLQEFLKTEALRSLTLCLGQTDWDNEVDESTQEIIRALCRAPFFQAISLSGISFVPTHFLEGATIKHLMLDDLDVCVGHYTPGEFSFDSTIYIDSLSSPPDLDSFAVQDLNYSSRALLPSSSHSDPVLPFSRLGKLASVIETPENLEATKILAIRSSRSLHTLHLIFTSMTAPCLDFHPELEPFNLQQFPRLRHLKIALVSTWFKAMSITNLLRFIPHASALQSLTVEIVMALHSPILPDGEPWQALKKALIQLPVQRLDLIIKTMPRGPIKANIAFVDSEFVTLAALFSGLMTDRDFDFTFSLNVCNSDLEFFECQTLRALSRHL